MQRAVLLTCHGTVTDLDDIAGFLQNIRRGRPAPPELVAEVRHRYDLIGGSPLYEETRAQAEALEARLGLPVRYAGRLWKPLPREVLEPLYAQGVREILSLPLAPQSVDVYHASVREAAAGLEGLSIVEAATWGEEPALVAAFVETVDDVLRTLPPAPPAETAIVLSAHSLPVRIIRSGDPYEAQFRAMAARVAAPLAARGHAVRVAFQSQGMTNDEWLGPDLEATFRGLVAEGLRRAVVAPIGFVAEHVETLYDLDVDAPAVARRAGLEVFARARAVSSRPGFTDAIEAVARRAFGMA